MRTTAFSLWWCCTCIYLTYFEKTTNKHSLSSQWTLRRYNPSTTSILFSQYYVFWLKVKSNIKHWFGVFVYTFLCKNWQRERMQFILEPFFLFFIWLLASLLKPHKRIYVYIRFLYFWAACYFSNINLWNFSFKIYSFKILMKGVWFLFI